MTEAHTEEEISLIIKLFTESIDEMIAAGFFVADDSIDPSSITATMNDIFDLPPMPDAKLGRDKDGNPAWFIIHPEISGKYLQVHLK